ncbi:MAG TPA: dihydrofolate reductase family protein [Solirubrobacteraceae bacterium]|jgi:dihydrofolate reductase
MSEVIWHTTMSLDGFIAGPDDDMTWIHGEFPETNAVADEVRQRTGAIVAGRRWHDLAAERWDGRHGIYGGDWDGPVFVVTHRPPPDDADPGITFVHEGVEAAVAGAREAAGGKAVGIFGANTARQVIESGLLDEIVIHVAPVLLGDGVRLHDAPGIDAIRLQGELTDLRYRL